VKTKKFRKEQALRDASLPRRHHCRLLICSVLPAQHCRLLLETNALALLPTLCRSGTSTRKLGSCLHCRDRRTDGVGERLDPRGRLSSLPHGAWCCFPGTTQLRLLHFQWRSAATLVSRADLRNLRISGPLSSTISIPSAFVAPDLQQIVLAVS
jgi:hypothetical protein